MTVLEVQLDISLLPHNAQQELLDFYEFLTQKYQRSVETKGKSTFATFLQTPIQVKKWLSYTREELHER